MDGSDKLRHSIIEPSPALPLDAAALAIAALFDQVEDVVFWIKDRAGCYRTVNRGFLLNFALDDFSDVIGRTDFDLEPDYIAAQFRIDDDRVLAGEPVVNRIELVGRYAHTAVWCVTNKMPLLDARRRVFGTAGITRRLRGGLATGPNVGASALARVIEYCRKNIARSHDNAELAHVAGLSQRGFERRFRVAFGVSPQQYLRRLRVRLACYPLVYSDQPLAEIATAHGFSDQSHFGREFRRETRLTPREYRARFRKH